MCLTDGIGDACGSLGDAWNDGIAVDYKNRCFWYTFAYVIKFVFQLHAPCMSVVKGTWPTGVRAR